MENKPNQIVKAAMDAVSKNIRPPKVVRDKIVKPLIRKIESDDDLPEYGKYVLVYGIDEKQYGIRRWHVCEMDDLEGGFDFKENGEFYWLTENGTKIDEVTHWTELPNEPIDLI